MFAGIDYELFDLINRRWTQTSADLIFLLATDPSSLYQATPRQAPHGPTLTIFPADPPSLKLWRAGNRRENTVNRFAIIIQGNFYILRSIN